MKRGHLIALALILSILAGCSPNTPSPSSPVSETPDVIVPETVMPSPAPIPTLTPAQGPKHTPTPSPRPLPLIDVHNHLPKGATVDSLIKHMDEAGIQITVLMPTFYSGGSGISDENLVLDFYKNYPERVIPFVGMQRDILASNQRWQQPDAAAESLLQFTESRLRTGLFKGIGEFILWHYPYTFDVESGSGGTVKIPADTPLMRRFLDLAAKYHVPVCIHYEIDEDSVSSLKSMLDYSRKTTIILAHNGGRPTPEILKALLDEYPNVFCDLAGMTRLGGYGWVSEGYRGGTYTIKNPIEDGTGHLRPEWKALYEQYPDRFIGIGLDQAHPPTWDDPERYLGQSTIFRIMLSDLSPQTAEKIAFGNAQKLFGIATMPTSSSAPVPTLKPSPKPSPTPTPSLIGKLPLIDVHDHLTPGLLPESIVSLMDQAGVQKIVLMANRIPGNEPMGWEDTLVLEAYEKYPQRIIPFLTIFRGYLSRFPTSTYLEYANRQLQTGKFKGMGEFMVRHYAITAPGMEAEDHNVPADSPLMQEMMRLGAKYNVPLVIHMETTPDTIAALDRALTANSNVKVIWAHQNPLKTSGGSTAEFARKGDPDEIAALLDKHPNLFADISLGYEGVFLNTTLDKNLPERWRKLYEKYNDRFMVGLDCAYKDEFEDKYVSNTDWYRAWLSQLSNDTAKKLAYENIEPILSQ